LHIAASRTFPQRTTGPLSNTQHQDGPGFGISFLKKLPYLGRLSEFACREGADTPEAGMFGDMQSDLGRGEAALFDCG
jgi:hypothetical protein